jgi:DNA polymerase III delta prime subunit
MKATLVGNMQLVAGTPEVVPQVLKLLQQQGIETTGNPDLYIRTYQRFGIDDAIELRDRAGTRAIREGARRIFIIATPSMTNEAQNALLKTIEEPPADAMFFFITPAPGALLQTLRSRSQILVLDSGKVEALVDAKKFIAAAPQKRLDMLKPLLEKGEDDKRDLGAIIAFLSDMEHACEKRADALHAVYRARKYIGDKGALVKPLLEQVALLV